MDKLILFTTSRCKGCSQARQLLRKLGASYEELNQAHPDEFLAPAITYDVSVFPTLVFVHDDDGVICEYEKVEGFAARSITEKLVDLMSF